MTPLTLDDLRRSRATLVMALAAVGCSVWAWLGGPADGLAMDLRAWEGEVWRLWTSSLIHANPIQLILYLACLTVLGVRVEQKLGSWAVGGLMVGWAIASGVWQHGLAASPSGLGGVVYGLYGLFLIPSGRKAMGLPTLEPPIHGVLLGWIAMGAVVTLAGWWVEGTVAQLSGLLLGAGLGIVLAPSAQRSRWVAVILGVGLLGVAPLVSARWRPALNLSSSAPEPAARLAMRALLDQHPGRAAAYYEWALRFREEADWWYNLGVAREQLDQPEAAARAFDRAVALSGGDPSLLRTLADRAWGGGDLRGAAVRLHQLLELTSHDAAAWAELARVRQQLGEHALAVAALRRATSLEAGHDVPLRNALKLAAHERMQQGQYDLAAPLYREALTLRREDGEAWYQLGLCYLAMGQVVQGTVALARAQELGYVPS